MWWPVVFFMANGFGDQGAHMKNREIWSWKLAVNGGGTDRPGLEVETPSRYEEAFPRPGAFRAPKSPCVDARCRTEVVE